MPSVLAVIALQWRQGEARSDFGKETRIWNGLVNFTERISVNGSTEV